MGAAVFSASLHEAVHQRERGLPCPDTDAAQIGGTHTGWQAVCGQLGQSRRLSGALKSLTHAAVCGQLGQSRRLCLANAGPLKTCWRTHTGFEDTDHSSALIGKVAHAGDHGGCIGPSAPIASYQRQHHQEPEGAGDVPGMSHSTGAYPPHVV